MMVTRASLRRLVLFLSLICGCGLTFGVAAAPLRVGYFDAPPHTGQGGSLDGSAVAVEYFKRIAQKMGVAEVEFRKYPLPRLLLLLEQGHLDVALILAKDQQRAAKFLYPQRAFFTTYSVLAVRADNPLHNLSSVQQLMPFKIGAWQDGYNHAFIKDPALNMVTLSGDNVCSRGLQMLTLGRIDGFYFPDAFAVQFDLVQEHLQDKIKLLPMPDGTLELYSVFSKSTGVQYLPAYEKALLEMRSEMSYEDFFISTLKN